MLSGPDAVFFRLLTICPLLFQFGHDNPTPTECTEPAKLYIPYKSTGDECFQFGTQISGHGFR